jgi:hypothetical protein
MTRPTVLLGETRSRAILDVMQGQGWGRMWTVEPPSLSHDAEPWGFDNGAFVAWQRGAEFPALDFERRLARAHRTPTRPIVAVAPDIVAGGARSLEFSLGWLGQLPADWPWYLAVQDGMVPEDVAEALPVFAGVFLGGTTAFKRTAQQWATLAHEAGIGFHYGRASVPKRLDHACRVGADSLDTAFPLWTRERLGEFLAHWTEGSPQMDLSGVPASTLALAGPAGEWY